MSCSSVILSNHLVCYSANWGTSRVPLDELNNTRTTTRKKKTRPKIRLTEFWPSWIKWTLLRNDARSRPSSSCHVWNNIWNFVEFHWVGSVRVPSHTRRATAAITAHNIWMEEWPDGFLVSFAPHTRRKKRFHSWVAKGKTKSIGFGLPLLCDMVLRRIVQAQSTVCDKVNAPVYGLTRVVHSQGRTPSCHLFGTLLSFLPQQHKPLRFRFDTSKETIETNESEHIIVFFSIYLWNFSENQRK